MLITCVVAVLIAGAREIRQNFPSELPWVFEFVWAGAFVAQGLAAAWATFASERTVPRGIAVLAAAPALGALLAYAAGGTAWDTYFYLTAIMALHTAAILASLSVVRSCGYRLVSRRTVSAVAFAATGVQDIGGMEPQADWDRTPPPLLSPENSWES